MATRRLTIHLAMTTGPATPMVPVSTAPHSASVSADGSVATILISTATTIAIISVTTTGIIMGSMLGVSRNLLLGAMRWGRAVTQLLLMEEGTVAEVVATVAETEAAGTVAVVVVGTAMTEPNPSANRPQASCSRLPGSGVAHSIFRCALKGVLHDRAELTLVVDDEHVPHTSACRNKRLDALQ